MKKRGISPLIATVLIIGFVIVLSSMVMIWGTDIFKKYQSESGAEAMAKLTCTTKVNVNIKEACDLGTSIRVKLENQADQNIQSLIYRIISPSGAAIDAINESLASFEVKTFYPKYFAVDNFYTKPNKIELLPRILIEGKEKTCPGTSKEIKPCLILPSLNILEDWDITGDRSGLLKDIKSIVKEAGFNDEVGIYAASISNTITIETKKDFLIPAEATSFFIRYITLSTPGDVNYELKLFNNDGTTFKTYTNTDQTVQAENIGDITIGYRFILIPEDKNKKAKLSFTKTNGGTLAITNLAYII